VKDGSLMKKDFKIYRAMTELYKMEKNWNILTLKRSMTLTWYRLSGTYSSRLCGPAGGLVFMKYSLHFSNVRSDTLTPG
jgi:hypothetical protein